MTRAVLHRNGKSGICSYFKTFPTRHLMRLPGPIAHIRTIPTDNLHPLRRFRPEMIRSRKNHPQGLP